ncbi:MAG: hypothetical protein R2747_08380 [Pyrinomonadaceae bacterium]
MKNDSENRKRDAGLIWALPMALLNLLVLASVGGLLWLVYTTILYSEGLSAILRGGFLR